MNDIPIGYLIALLIILVLCSAFFSSSETGLLSLNRYRLRHKAREGHTGAKKASELLSKPDRLLGTILVGNNVVNIMAASIATVVCLQLWGDAGVAIATAGMTIIIIIFGEITPKTLAALRPELVAYPSSHILKVLMLVLTPIVWLTSSFSNIILRLLGINPKQKVSDSLSTEELRTIVRDSHGGLTRNGKEMMLGILDLEKITVNDILIPRNEVFGIDLNSDLNTIIWLLRTTTHTRIPVFHDNINQIVGVIHMRQIARLLTLNKLTHEDLQSACNAPYFIPESTPLSIQLLNFKQNKRRFAIVVDEYGDVEGIVTLEDILEEIVGDFSAPENNHEPETQRQEDGSFIIDGTAHVRELNKELSWHLPIDGPKTINGLITEHLEDLPDGPVCLQLGNYYLETLEIRDNRIISVLVREIKPTTSSAT